MSARHTLRQARPVPMNQNASRSPDSHYTVCALEPEATEEATRLLDPELLLLRWGEPGALPLPPASPSDPSPFLAPIS
eukprot:scaffold62164_cov63-Phaeocystis_antarctica.AAC.2